MNLLRFLWNYVRWHYSDAIVDLWYIYKNYTWGIGHIFSADILLRTLFIPWHRLGSHTASLFSNPFDYFGDLLVNLVMRLLGFVSRVLLLTLALLSALFTIALFFGIFIAWIVLPIILCSLLINAIAQFFL